MIIVLVLIIIAFIAILSVQNAAPVIISFLAWRFEAPFEILVFFAVLSGVLVMQLQRWGRKRSSTNKQPCDMKNALFWKIAPGGILC
jgi:uncharacterized integral membrane protein